MNGIAHSYAASMMQTYPTGTAGCIDEGIQDRPVGYRITTIHHGFSFAIGRSHGSGIEMIATDHDRRLYFSGAHQFIESKSGFFPFTLTQPADTGGKSLKSDLFLRHIEPTQQSFIIREHFTDKSIRNSNIRRIPTECCPTKRSLSFAEKRTNIGRYESGEIKRTAGFETGYRYIWMFLFVFCSTGPDIIAVIKSDSSL